MSYHKIEIKTEGMCSHISIDGVDISSQVVGFKYTHDAGNRPILRLDFLPSAVSLECDSVPELPDSLKPFYELKSCIKGA